MALDNLITLQQRYNRAPEGLFGTDVHIIDVTNIILVLFIFLLNYCLNNKGYLYSKAKKQHYKPGRYILFCAAGLTAFQAWTLLFVTVFSAGAIFIFWFHYEIVNWVGIACIAVGVIDTKAALEYQQRHKNGESD